MDAKYCKGGNVALPQKETRDGLDRIGAELQKQWGFKPSRSDVIAFLVKQYEERNGISEAAPEIDRGRP